MSKKNLIKSNFIISLLIAGLSWMTPTAFSQDTSVNGSVQVIFVRHAERSNDDPRDPNLSEEGFERAARLFTLLESQSLAAVYSTDYRRTRSTVTAIAEHNNIEINLYDETNIEFIESLVSRHREESILIVGHSNTTPTLINLLLGEERFTRLGENEYGNVFIVTASGVGQATVLRLQY